MKFIEEFINKRIIRLKEISIKRYICTNILFTTFVLVNLLCSWLLRIVTMGDLFSIKAIISDLAFIFFTGAFAYLLKPKKQIRILLPLTIIMMLTCVINAVYYENYISFASFSLLSTASFLGSMDTGVVTTLIQPKDMILIFSPIVLLIVNKVLKKVKYFDKVEQIENNKKRFFNTMILAGTTFVITLLLMAPSDYSRLKKQWNREYLVERFGIYVYQVNDAIKSTQSKFTTLFGYDTAAKIVREYYETKDTIKKTNEYTNIFEGKNIIAIHAESIMTEDMTLSFNGEALTPNLNKIADEGLFFSNFYSQVSVGTSSDSEFSLNTSLLPVTNGTVFVNYWDRTYDSIPWLLKDKGYYALSMHANNASFWNRNVMHKTLGYDMFYAKESYEIDEVVGMGLSDKSFFKQSTEKLKKVSEEYGKFYATVIMLSNHTPWDDKEAYGDFPVNYKTTKLDEQGNQVEVTLPYLEGTLLGNYYKGVHYADEAIGEFINELDEAGLLENTVIVIYGDHDARIAKKEYSYFYNYNLETGEQYDKDDENYDEVDYYDYELNRKVPFIIWTKDSKNSRKLNKEITKVMGMYDILPTLGNMFNFESKYALGHDIFSIDNNIVVYPNGNWLTDNIYYNSQKDEHLSLNGAAVSKEEIEKNKTYANTILSVSDSLIIYDLQAKETKNEEK